ncbi:MAG: hypothetical protein ABI537_07895 [Casimicrobiaceae bacterium]
MPAANGDLAFSFRVASSGEVSIVRHARVVTLLRAKVALDFLADVEGLAFEDQQQLMARLTGNYKRGNERRAGNHPRNCEPNGA